MAGKQHIKDLADINRIENMAEHVAETKPQTAPVEPVQTPVIQSAQSVPNNTAAATAVVSPSTSAPEENENRRYRGTRAGWYVRRHREAFYSMTLLYHLTKIMTVNRHRGRRGGRPGRRGGRPSYRGGPSGRGRGRD